MDAAGPLGALVIVAAVVIARWSYARDRRAIEARKLRPPDMPNGAGWSTSAPWYVRVWRAVRSRG